jgi:hypothetical protein
MPIDAPFCVHLCSSVANHLIGTASAAATLTIYLQPLHD